MILFRRQCRKNLKELIIWTLSIAGLLALMVGQFKSMGAGVDTSGYSEQLKSALGLDKLDMNTFLGYYAIKASVMVTLFGGIYAAILGSGMIVKDESLLSRPVSRGRILLERLLAGALNLLLLNLVIMVIVYMAEKDSLILWIALGQYLLHMIFFSMGMLIAVLKLRSKTALMLPIGIVLATYVVTFMYGISDKLEPLKYLTPFWYTDVKEIIMSGSMSTVNTIISIIFILVFAVSGYFVYIKRDLPS